MALESWRLSPFPPPTRSPEPVATATAPPPATATATVPPTATRTRPPTRIETPRPTFTATPEPRGQIAFGTAGGIPPAQRLASAVVVLPYVVSTSQEDTRIELFNMSDHPLRLDCFYVRQVGCFEVGFSVQLTQQQPLSWLASRGTSNPLTFTAVPPFDGVGELKCAVIPSRPELSFHNVLQGRALVFDRFDGETVGYGAIGFQRLTPGPFSGVVNLDGFTYEQCLERLHFQVLSRPSGGRTSTLILATCSEDLLTQVPTETVVQLQIVNEFEQVFSSSFRFSCHTTQSFSRLSAISKFVLGTDTAHLVIRGVAEPVVGLVVDRFEALGGVHTNANDPFLEGGRSATIIFP